MHQDKPGKKLSAGKITYKVGTEQCKALEKWGQERLLLLKSPDPGTSVQMKDPERGSPLLREPREVTWSQCWTSKRSHLAAFSRAWEGWG